MRTILIICALTLAACQPVPASTGQAVVSTQQMADAPSGSMQSLLNTARSAQGLGPVSEDPRLSRAARDHAQDMLSNNYFAHRGRNGSSFSDRARTAGYTCAAAENIAFGQPSEAVVMTEWMNSPGHRRNILLGNATEFGIGRAGNHWVLKMGRGC